MSVEFKNLAQAELCATLEVMLKAEGIIRHAAKNDDMRVQFAGSSLYFGAGLCHYIEIQHDQRVAKELYNLNEIYAGLHDTHKLYPVPPATDFEPSDLWDGETPPCECAFDDASRNELWGEGEYAQNRWDYIRWLVDYMKNQPRIKEL